MGAGLGERSAVLGAMEGQYLAKALKWADEVCSVRGALVAGGPVPCPVTRSEFFDTISLQKVL
jgi:hypothetical protein